MAGLKRTSLFIFLIFVILPSSVFGGAAVTAYAADDSLPGDALFPIKTRLEKARVELANDPMIQAYLHLDFARRRLSEIQSLMERGRYDDLAFATAEFVYHIQKALYVFDSFSQTDPVQASILKGKILALLHGYKQVLTQNLLLIPGSLRPVIEKVETTSTRVTNAVNDDDSRGVDGNNAHTGSAIVPTMTPMIIILPSSTPTAIPAALLADPVIEGGGGTCTGVLGAVTVENLQIPQGASCNLDGTRVQGNIKVENGASLMAQRVTVIGNIQAEGARYVEVLAGSTVGGSIQLKQGGSARVEFVSVNGDIQFESNHGVLSAIGNQVGGNIQVFQNGGGVSIADNTVNGNLQCKESNPAPVGGNNTVQGNKEDQCAGL